MRGAHAKSRRHAVRQMSSSGLSAEVELASSVRLGIAGNRVAPVIMAGNELSTLLST